MPHLHLTQPGKRIYPSFFVALVLISLIIFPASSSRAVQAALRYSQPIVISPIKNQTIHPNGSPNLESLPLICTGDFIDKWSTGSKDFQVINSCTLTVPTGGKAYINAGASLGLVVGSQNYEGRFRLAVDGANLIQMDRWVNIYRDNGDGSDASLAMSTIEAIGPGTHTFSLVGSLWNGPGSILLYRPTLNVWFFPSTTKNLLCTAPTIDAWSTTEITFQPIRSCTLNVPVRGTVYIDANATASLAGAGAPYEGSFRLALDGIYLAQTERRVNIYTDNGDGSDATLATSTTQTLEAGPHTFTLAAKLYSGMGPLQVYRPAISVIFSPEDPFPPMKSTLKSSPALDNWFSSSYDFKPITVTTLNLACPATILVQANASVGLATLGPQPYEAHFQIKVDGTGYIESDRWLNIYTDDGDGTDKSLATFLVRSFPSGSHTFELDARLYSGVGPIQIYDPVVTVMTIYDCPVNYLPLVRR